MTHAQLDLLTGLTTEQARDVMALAHRLVLSTGAELFRLGADADSLYVILRGRVKLTLPMQVRGGDEEVMVEERTPGQTVGWSALTPPYKFTLTASTPLETEVLALSRRALQAHFEANPAVGRIVAMNLAAVIGERLQMFQAMWLREMQRTVELRCA